jgi:hypothetical protein
MFDKTKVFFPIKDDLNPSRRSERAEDLPPVYVRYGTVEIAHTYVDFVITLAKFLTS